MAEMTDHEEIRRLRRENAAIKGDRERLQRLWLTAEKRVRELEVRMDDYRDDWTNLRCGDCGHCFEPDAGTGENAVGCLLRRNLREDGLLIIDRDDQACPAWKPQKGGE